MNLIIKEKHGFASLIAKCLLSAIFACCVMEVSAATTVTGRVTDVSGEPLIGVTVSIRGAYVGGAAVTNFDGNYSVSVPDGNAVLVFAYLGFSTQEITVGNQAVINVILKEDAKALEEVVVVGYGTQKKVNLTGSVEQINFADQAMTRPITTVSSALSGLLSGVSVRQTSGEPGSDGASILIRGQGTMNDASPLIIIDGIEGSMDAVNPQDIATITTLKDAASCAIYGVRGANGVILVTTKKGQPGKVHLNYSGVFSWNRPSNLIDLVSDYATYMELMNEGYNNVGLADNFPQATIDLWREKSKNPNATDTPSGVPNYVAYPNTKWADEFYHGDVMQDHNLSLSGAADNVRYLLSIGFLDNPGLVENTGIKRYSLRSNLESDVTKWLTVGLNLFGSQRDKDVGRFSTANNYLRQTTPGVYPRWKGIAGGPEVAEESAMANSLYTFLNANDGRNTRTQYSATIFSRAKIWKGLSWDFNYNYSKQVDENKQWSNAQNARKMRFSDGYLLSQATSLSEMTSEFTMAGNKAYTLQNLLRYNTVINKDHDLNALLGYEETAYYEYSYYASKKGFTAENLNVPDAVLNNENKITGTALDRASRSIFGRINYAYQNKYLAEFDLRRDYSSRFAADYRGGTFPSASLGWRVMEESFMDNLRDKIDNLKLRLSYGQLGNQGGSGLGEYDYQSLYGSANYPIGDAVATGFKSALWSNSSLSWETTNITNVGIDIAVLQNRLNATIEYYDKFVDGILYYPPIPEMAADASAPRMNLAQVDTKGLDFSINWNDKIGNVYYSVSGNFGYNHNRIVKYKGAFTAGWVDNPDGTRTWTTNFADVNYGDVNSGYGVEGHPIGTYYLRTVYHGDGTYFNADGTPNPNGGPKDGMIRTEADMQWLTAMMAAADGSGKDLYTFKPNDAAAPSQTKLWYGDLIYADNNGDGIFGDDNDRKFHGSRVPKYNYGLQASAAWKGVDFSMNWAGAAGFQLYWAPETGYNSTGVRLGLAIPTAIANDHYYYDPADPNNPKTNINGKYSRLVAAESGYPAQYASDYYLFKGDYLKLKNLTIGYTLPQQLTRKISLDKVRVFATGENLLTITAFPGLDPEMGYSTGYTSMRQFALGINVSF